jgi:ABC-type transport system involved in multi-copper enzyme maturation permease subunit
VSATTGLRPPVSPERAGFGSVVRAEWVKFRTVRGWLIGLVIAVLACALFTYLVANGTHSGTCTGNGSNCQSGHPFVPTGPDGQAVADSYEYLTRPLIGNGSITVQVASLTGRISSNPVNVAPSLSATRPGLARWAKAGLLITPSTRQGSPYAAVMATASHGIRFQYNYTNDRPGLSGAVSARSPGWVRLTRRGDTITGYDSANGASWQKIGIAQLSGLPATVDVGLFVTSPVSFQDGTGYQTQATATFHRVTLAGEASVPWQSHSIGISQADFYPTLGAGDEHSSRASFVLTGSGDIAPAVVQGLLGTNTAASTLLLGLTAGLIVLIVIAAMFITSEYRRGLIRTTFIATPQRGQVLAAKAIVIGAVAFAIGAIAAAGAVPVGEHLLTKNGAYVFPASAATVACIVAGCGLVTALTAIAVLALGAMLRRSAGAVTAGIVVFVLPYVIGSSLSGGAETWLFRLTPAAAFSVLGTPPRSALVDYPYTFANGYYPLSPWAGLLVLAAYTALCLCAARFLLARRDA